MLRSGVPEGLPGRAKGVEERMLGGGLGYLVPFVRFKYPYRGESRQQFRGSVRGIDERDGKAQP